MSTEAWSGSEWESWGSSGGDKWKPSENVGACVRLTVVEGHKVIPGTKYGDWEFLEADVDVIDLAAGTFTKHPKAAVSGQWFLGTFAEAPKGYQALGVVISEEFANGTGYKIRPLTAEEKAKALEALGLPGF
jgi:hypothetical protein